MEILNAQLQTLDRFEVHAKSNVKIVPTIVFIIAGDGCALKSAKFQALENILRLFGDETFEDLIESIGDKIKQNKCDGLNKKLAGLLADLQNQDSKNTSEAYQNRLIIKSSGKAAFVEIEDIDWITADGCYAAINVGEKTHLMRESLKNLEEILDPKTFLRIHRSTIINTKRIEEMHSHFNGGYLVLLKDGKRFKISHSYKEKAELLLSGKL